MSRQIEVFLTNQLRNRPLCANITIAKSKRPHGRKDAKPISFHSVVDILSTKSASNLNALMVKRLRRRPLTAESGVRFPMGVPKKTSPLGLVFFIRCLQRHVINACVVCNCNRCVSPMAYCTLRVRNFVARTPEHWADASLCEQTHSFSLFHDSPWGYQKKQVLWGLFFLSVVYNGM